MIAANLRKQSKKRKSLAPVKARPLPLPKLLPKLSSRKIYTMINFDIPDVVWVERFVVGMAHPDKYLTQEEINQQMNIVNRALRYGKIISVEQNFTILSIEDKDILTQYTVYHVGFKQRPPRK